MKSWRERIVEAKERGGFTREDFFLAGNTEIGGPPDPGYARCAVGEQADHYGADLFFLCPEDRFGVKDERLATWGGEFAGAVYGDDFTRAESLLSQIEDRALQIKRGDI
jgi:hypothetical protein